jgi:hypothetical protein
LTVRLSLNDCAAWRRQDEEPLAGQGYVDGVSIRHVVQFGAAPNEIYWAQRFPGAMQFVLGSR